MTPALFHAILRTHIPPPQDNAMNSNKLDLKFVSFSHLLFHTLFSAPDKNNKHKMHKLKLLVAKFVNSKMCKCEFVRFYFVRKYGQDYFLVL